MMKDKIVKNLIKVISITAILAFTAGCGDSANRVENISKEIPPPIKKPKNCSELLKHSIDTIEILDSSLECPPNVNLYHAEVKPTYYEYRYDDDYKANVLYFKSNGIKNAIHILGYDTQEMYEWNEYPNYQNKFNISWDAKFNNDFVIYVVLTFQDKNETIQKDLVYTTLQNSTDDVNLSLFMPIKLDDSYKDGEWHHYDRNIIDDLHIFYPDANMVYDENYKLDNINGFALRGTGSITDIKLNK